MKILKQVIPLLFVLFAVGYTILNWDLIPDKYPSSLDQFGVVDHYRQKDVSIYSISILGIITFFLLQWLKKFVDFYSESKFEKMWLTLISILMIIFAWFQIQTVVTALGKQMPLPSIFILIGLGNIILGNFMPNLKHNFILGFRNVWTTKSEYVWKKTHQFAAPLYFYSGVLITLMGLLTFKFIISQFLVIVFVLLAIINISILIKSYLLSKEEEKTIVEQKLNS